MTLSNMGMTLCNNNNNNNNNNHHRPLLVRDWALVARWLLVPAATRTGLSLPSTGSIPDTALREVSGAHTHTP
jgi:hypothetical protein